ncbi:120655ad-08f9-467f-b973-bdc50ab1d584 [Thermothielavioides terrestris]|uniref:120655ad-08f9-467f-b973-bdc50ab1d584 n=1 Tax=Thermothielavioides terrestris TaxID=2587410 RepID=A0A3S4EUK0_9PEZI|nr:120655ad-08f9-467f-b973-bdc50ab1d584 [Thermothielavioides terrestris]
MQDAGPYAAAVHPGHNNLSHAIHQQAALTAHYARCPYEEKVITNGTTARMVLVFLRELLEQLPAGEQVQQSYGCPMTKCHRTFSAPLQVIQHLLSCPELLNGEFDCDKCNTWHSFPTNEKDWAQWTGWRSPTSPHPIQRKRSLGSKMKETFALRKKDASRKQNSVFDPHFKGTYPMDTRPSTAASETPSMAFASRAFEQHGVFPAQPEQRLDFSALQKPMSPNGLLDVSDSMFWSGLNASDLPSTVSSVAISSAADESPSEPFSQNTSQTTLFSSGLGPYQSPTSAARDSSKTLEARPFIFATQPPFGPALTSLPAHPPSVSAMSLDDPAPANQAPLSPAELGQTATNGGQAWWDPKVDK